MAHDVFTKLYDSLIVPVSFISHSNVLEDRHMTHTLIIHGHPTKFVIYVFFVLCYMDMYYMWREMDMHYMWRETWTCTTCGERH